jgi:Ca2+-binding EF-hand superfamily protein
MDEVMAFVDADGDGSIDTSEFLRLSRMKDEHEAAMAAEVDVHREERAALLHGLAERKASVALAFSALLKLMGHPDAVQFFERFDTDGDGHVTKAELQAGFRLIGERLDEAAMDEVMAFVDADGYGYIRTSEFLRLRRMKDELEKIEAQARGLPPPSGVQPAMNLDLLDQQASASAALAAALETVRRAKLSRKPTAVKQQASLVEQSAPVERLGALVEQRSVLVEEGDAQMIAALFERFDIDKDGFHNLKESQELALFVHDHVLRRGEFLDLCADLDADAKRGITIQQFTTIYTDPEFHADLQGDHKKVFGARQTSPRKQTRNRSSSAIY